MTGSGSVFREVDLPNYTLPITFLDQFMHVTLCAAFFLKYEPRNASISSLV